MSFLPNKKKQPTIEIGRSPSNQYELEVQFIKGINLLKINELSKAKNIFTQILIRKPDHFKSLHILGIIAAFCKEHDLALDLIGKSLKINSDNVQAYYHQGSSLDALKRFKDAIASYDIAIKINPNFAEAYYKRGDCYRELNQLVEAVVNFDRAIELKSNFIEAYNKKGVVLLEQRYLKKALELFDYALYIKYDFADVHNNRGIVLAELQCLEESLVSFNNALVINPSHFEAHVNHGNVLIQLMRLEDAHTSYDKAIEINPDMPEAYWGKSVALLLNGQFEQGLKFYEWRWEIRDLVKHKRNFAQPLLLSTDDITFKTVLLHAEQGLGDTIQFCRYASLLKNKGARVVMELPKTLIYLLSDLHGVDEIVEKGKPLPNFDYQCPMLSLPLAFKTDLTNIPNLNKYISANAKKCKEWEKILGKKKNQRVGLVWTGSEIHKNDHNRSLTLKELLPLLPSEYQYVCLQKELREIDKQSLIGSEIKYYGDQINDFADTAAICELMDIVICVDTSVAHLSGAMGKTTWVLLPYVPDWRWLLNRDNSPWYESMKLYRQEKDRKWTPVLLRVVKDLQEFLQQGQQQ